MKSIHSVLSILLMLIVALILGGCAGFGARPADSVSMSKVVAPTVVAAPAPAPEVAPAPAPAPEVASVPADYRLEHMVENCVGSLMRVSSSVDRAADLTRATDACSHIYGLRHNRRIEEFEILSSGSTPVRLDEDSLLPASALRDALFRRTSE